MASIRKRIRDGKAGTTTTWQLSYFEPDGKRRYKDFALKKDAEAEKTRIDHRLAQGVYISDKNSLTLQAAAESYLNDFEDLVKQKKRERTTWRGYVQHVDYHIKPDLISSLNLTEIRPPLVQDYIRRLEASKSDAMARKVFKTLKQIFDYSKGKGWIAENPGTGLKVVTSDHRTGADEIEIPLKTEIARMFEAARQMTDDGRTAAIFETLALAGLRPSELRALAIADVQLKECEIHIRRRADRYNKIGPPKTKNGRRIVKISPELATTLKKWILQVPKSDLNLVFPNGAGNVESLSNIWNRIYRPLMTAAKLMDEQIRETEDGKQVLHLTPRYNIKSLRHTAVSLWIDQGFSVKKISKWAGHGSVAFTLDTYGHLFADDDDDEARLSLIYQEIKNSLIK